MNIENELKVMREAEEKILHRMVKVNHFLEMWQGSEDLHGTQKESRAQNTQMTAEGYISDTEGIVKASWSNFQHEGAAAFIFSGRSPVPPAWSAEDLLARWTEVLNVGRMKRIDHHPAGSNEDNTPESISDNENWLD